MREIRQAIITRLSAVSPISDITYYWFEPDELDAPAIVVLPDDPFVDYRQTFQHGLTEWNFVLTLFANRMDEESAQELLDEWTDPRGPFVLGLHSDDIDDALWALAPYGVEVMSGVRYGGFVQGNTRYLVAQLRVCVKAK
jgi:hypothetical protein